jgi:hypothetical protein
MLGHGGKFAISACTAATRRGLQDDRLVEMPSPTTDEKKDPFAGLCASCINARRMESDRGSVFTRCELSLNDSRFPKYPRLPVLTCSGYERANNE